MKLWLVTSLWVLILTASAVAAFGLWVLPIAGFSVVMRLGRYRWSAGVRNAPTVLAAIFVAFLLSFPFALSMHEQVMEAVGRVACRNRIERIASALLKYEQSNHSFPPAYIAGADGKPWHSWRVLLLPFMDLPDVYKMYDFDQPWDGPKNRQLADNVWPYLYSCFDAPFSGEKPPRTTNYVALTGPGTAWPGLKPTRLSDIGDVPGKTILLVEIADSDISWMEPRDPSLEEVLGQSAAAQPAAKNRLADSHFSDEPPGVRGAWVAMADASVHFLPAGFSKEQLKALATINGGEDVGLPDPAPRNAWQRLTWLNRIGLAVFLVSLVALIWRVFRRPKGSH